MISLLIRCATCGHPADQSPLPDEVNTLPCPFRSRRCSRDFLAPRLPARRKLPLKGQCRGFMSERIRSIKVACLNMFIVAPYLELERASLAASSPFGPFIALETK